MKIHLQPANSPLPTGAAFLHGGSPREWLLEMSRWGLPPNDLECYAAPASRDSIEAAGLFVVFKKPAAAQGLDLMDAYAALAGRLYIPAHSRLLPQASDNELAVALTYKRQFLHPRLGLLGFNREDELDLATLLHPPKGEPTPWDRAVAGPPPPPPLQRINLQLPPPETILQSLGDGVERKPLKDIPQDEDEKEKGTQGFWGKFRKDLLDGGMGLSKDLRDALSSEHGTRNPPEWWDKLDQWMAKKRADLQKKRDDEINRLLKLFDKDPDEALRYALPLNSPYAGRGTAPPSDRLDRNSTNFNLGGLGGGRSVDGWNIGNRYFDLQAKYRRMAEALTQKGDYRRAAYVYAHLLGDFNAAANVLKQGKYYAEAAALYRKHLNNKAAAAQCLEEGGLLFEAIDLYKELEKFEKVGDLYARMEQHDQALVFYEKVARNYIEQRDFPEAARVLQHKIHDLPRAKQSLLDGWNDSRQPETCLNRYFDLPREADELLADARMVYEQHTPIKRRTMFLDALIAMNRKHNEEGLLDGSREIAYEIISRQTEWGDSGNLHKLKHFLPNDRLIAGDISRYLHLQRSKPPQREAVKRYELSKFFQLERSVTWLAVTHRHHQYLALGKRDGQLQVARWNNSSEQREYHSVAADIRRVDSIHIAEGINDDYTYLIYAAGVVFDKVIPYVPNLGSSRLLSLPHLPNNMVGFSQGRDERFTVFKGGLHWELQHFNGGRVLDSHIIFNHIENEAFSVADPSQRFVKVIRRRRRFYMAAGHDLLCVSLKGNLHQHRFKAPTRGIAAYGGHGQLRLAVATDAGCQILYYDQEKIHEIGMIFAKDLKADHLLFMGELLLIADGSRVQVYQTSAGATPVYQGGFSVKAQVLALLPGASRLQVTVVMVDGGVCEFGL